MCGCLTCASHWGLGLKPRYVPWLGIEPATLWFTGQCSIHWATPARAIFYWLCYYSCPNFSPLPPLPQTLLHHCSCPWVLRISSLTTPFLYCTLHPHGYSVATYLHFLIPSPPYPVSHTPTSSGNHQNTLSIHDWVSVLLVLLVCFFRFNCW